MRFIYPCFSCTSLLKRNLRSKCQAACLHFHHLLMHQYRRLHCSVCDDLSQLPHLLNDSFEVFLILSCVLCLHEDCQPQLFLQKIPTIKKMRSHIDRHTHKIPEKMPKIVFKKSSILSSLYFGLNIFHRLTVRSNSLQNPKKDMTSHSRQKKNPKNQSLHLYIESQYKPKFYPR